MALQSTRVDYRRGFSRSMDVMESGYFRFENLDYSKEDSTGTNSLNTSDYDFATNKPLNVTN